MGGCWPSVRVAVPAPSTSPIVSAAVGRTIRFMYVLPGRQIDVAVGLDAPEPVLFTGQDHRPTARPGRRDASADDHAQAAQRRCRWHCLCRDTFEGRMEP